uniref:Hypoxanthine phosphoribosyltransferase n=4 Tax=Candidatus Kentrum eta TaxID=2126337 RepID=A0A450VDY2_9GAMM|nr:MAG: hypoxanthine phosphoribosyltransferase [Candidatus Kentron sp. H]
MNMISMLVCRSGGTLTKRFAIATANMLVMRMVMDFAKYMSIPWRDFGLCCALGYALIVVFLKNCYLTILDFSSSCLTQNNELKGSWSLYLNSFLSINLEFDKSLTSMPKSDSSEPNAPSPALRPEEMDRVLHEADLLYTPEEIDAAYDGMAAAITRTLTERLGRYGNPLVLAVPIGGLFPATAIVSRLDFPLAVDYIHATRYRGGTTGKELHFLSYPRTPLHGRAVIVMDDILDEGVTLAAILDYCRKNGASPVFSAVLVEKRHNRGSGIRHADFTGLPVADRYVFGAGMDYKGYLRNAPGIYAVRGL